jgi:hypothetical protein
MPTTPINVDRRGSDSNERREPPAGNTYPREGGSSGGKHRFERCRVGNAPSRMFLIAVRRSVNLYIEWRFPRLSAAPAA